MGFAAVVAGEVRTFWDVLPTQDAPAVDPREVDRLPVPVRNYLTRAIGTSTRFLRSARLQQAGTFRPSLDGRWLPIRAEQYFGGDPPGFIWWGRVRVAPGIWIDARDESLNGIGSMLVRAESMVTLADVTGADLDESALQRLLGELVWMPTAYLDSRYIRWTEADRARADATLTVGPCAVTGSFEFGADGFPRRFLANRFRDVNGRPVLTPFIGECTDYRQVDGMTVPFHVEGSWVIDGAPIPFARFDVTRIEFDAREPFEP